MIKVSIIVPVYNESQYLKICLNSLMSQTLDDIEIIAIDDNSNDDSLNILKRYARRYANLHVYHNEENIGLGSTRNMGIKLAKGEYIGFVDSDDYVNPRMFKEMYDAALRNDYPEMVTTGVRFVKDDVYAKCDLSFLANNKEIIIRPSVKPESVIFESPSVCNKIFRKDTIKDYYFIEDCMFEDIPFSYTKYMEASKVVFVPNANYFYRRDVTKGLSSKNYRKNDSITDIFRVLDKLENDMKKSLKYELFKDEIKLIQLGYSLIRVEEINNWQLDLKDKNIIIEKMFSLIEEKYGNLDGVDITLLESNCGMNIVDAYSNYLDKIKERPKSL